MTSKELVTICRTCADCYECSCEKECLAYSDTEIKIPLWLRLLYKFIV